MSDFVVHKGQRPTDEFARHYGAETVEVAFSPFDRSLVLLSDDRTGHGTCLGCGYPPCMVKDPSELTLPGALEAYPGDPSLDVCPTRAIGWDGYQEVATVNADICIGCGLCVSRCPYGAINLVAGAVASVVIDDPDGLVRAADTRGDHPSPLRTGKISELNAPAANALPTTVGALDAGRSSLLVRNLFNEVGVNMRTRRRGDTNMRIDAVGYTRSGRPVVAEIEFSDPLESPRTLLEDVAILHDRYGYDVADVDPVSVLLTLPNDRTEYYQVIRDIENVLGLRCRTITAGALIAVLWTNGNLEGFNGDSFALGEGTMDLIGSLPIDPSSLSEPYPGAFVPVK